MIMGLHRWQWGIIAGLAVVINLSRLQGSLFRFLLGIVGSVVILYIVAAVVVAPYRRLRERRAGAE